MFTCCCCCRSNRHNKYEIELAQRSREIDRQLEREKRLIKRQVKILLLGAGESGKSTFLKQMRVIHNLQWTDAELQEYTQIIYMNVVQGIRVLCDAHIKLNIPWTNPSTSQHAAVLLQHKSSFIDQYKFLQLIQHVKICWHDESVKFVFKELRYLFQLSDAVGYFLGELDRIGGKDYTPSTTDILHTRRATKGVYELPITIHTIPFIFYDIGGQRSQRAKWTQCFAENSLTAVIFLVACSEYDQMLAEDRSVNRLAESVAVFEVIVNNRVFRQIGVVLFLNKVDLLVEKVTSATATHNLHTYFPSYNSAPNDLESIQHFILTLFTTANRIQHEFYIHWTTAIDTEKIRVIFNAVKETILKRNLSHLMLE